MTISLVGQKKGMTRVFVESGESIPVTVIEVLPNVVTQIKNEDRDGYRAIQITTGRKKASRVNKPQAGHFASANTEPGRGLWEFRLGDDEGADLKVGDSVHLDVLTEGQYIDVTGVSKGKGFAGVVKRHNFATQDATHGNSLAHRAPGSIGQNQTPGRVFKNKKMAGQMGHERSTVQAQQIVKIDKERNLLLLKGVVPGAPGGDVVIKPTAKTKQVSAQGEK